jgi:hypothetical protein
MRRKLAFLTLALALSGLSALQTSAAATTCPTGTVPCACDGRVFACLTPARCAAIHCP